MPKKSIINKSAYDNHSDRMNLEEKINIVKNILKDKKVIIAFSAGSDSTLLAHLSKEVSEKTLAITIDNGLFGKDFIENARNSTKKLGINHEIITVNFYEDNEILKNNSRRCYNCRRLMYEKILQTAKEKDYDYICDGNNISDLVADRPGILITYEYDMKTPLIEARLTSKEIHEYLETNNIQYHKSTTCLATRIATDTPIKEDTIEKINRCESYIQENTNCQIVKVRSLDTDAIVEVDDISEIIKEEKHKQICDKLKKEGYKRILLNLSPIVDDDEIILEYADGSYRYQLPYHINIEKTIEKLENIRYNEAEIETSNIMIYESGLVEGYGYKCYDEALDEFMNILTKIRRKR